MGFNVPNSSNVGTQNVFQRPNLELSKKDTPVVSDPAKTQDESIMTTDTTTTNPVDTSDKSILPQGTDKPGIAAEEKADVVLEDGTVVSGTYCKESDVPLDKMVPDDPLSTQPSDMTEDKYVQMTLPNGEVVYAKEGDSLIPGKTTYTYKDADGNLVTVDKKEDFGLSEPRIIYDA